MSKYIKYLKYLIKHKWFVFIECCKLGIPWRGIVHDLSKLLPDEFIPYARYFYGDYPKASKVWIQCPSYTGPTKESVERDFDLAWLRHQNRNPHHWQYWLLQMDSPNERWTIQQHSIENPLHLAVDGKRLLTCTVESDDEIHTSAVRSLAGVVDILNSYRTLAMPDKYRNEMLADWRGAGRAITGKDNTEKWYNERRDRLKAVLHTSTQKWIEEQLGIKQ